MVSRSEVWKIMVLAAIFCTREGLCNRIIKNLGEWRGFFVEDYSSKTHPNIPIDIDYDGVDDSQDNCPSTPNPIKKILMATNTVTRVKWEIKIKME